MSDQERSAGGMHLSADQLRKYSEKLLAPDELLRIDAHLAGCLQCRDDFTMRLGAIPDSLAEEFLSTNEDEHLSYDQIVQFMERKDKEGRAAMHLNVCARCSKELRDLQSYTKEFDSERGKSPFPWFLTAAAVLALIAIATALLFQQRKVQEVATSKPVRAMVSVEEPGTRLTLDPDGKLSGLEGLSQSDQQMVIQALRTRRIETPHTLRELIGERGTLRGDEPSDAFQVLAPSGTFVIKELPLFRWNVLPGASKYKVTILDDQLTLMDESPWIQTTSWKAGKPLPRNRTLIWQVVASRNGAEVVSPQPPAPQARFRILDQQSFEQLRIEIKQASNSNLLLALIYARYGVLDEAEKHLQLVANTNPHSKEINQLLEDLKKVRS